MMAATRRHLLWLCHKEWLLLRRDVNGLAVLFLMPVVFILIMSLAMEDSFRQRGSAVLDVAVVDLGAEASDFQRRLAEDGGFNLVVGGADQQAVFRQRVSDGDIQGVVVLPADVDARIADVKQAIQLPLLVSPSILPQTRVSLEQRLRGHVYASRAQRTAETLAVITNQTLDDSPAAVEIETVAVGMDAGEQVLVPSSVQQNVPAWLVFAMFFVVFPLSNALLVERLEGGYTRLRLLGVSAFSYVGAKCLSFYVVNMLQAGLMLLVGVYGVQLFGGEALRIGDGLAGLFVMASAISISALGLGMIISVLVSSHVQATLVGGVVNLILGAVGGVMVPKFIMPEMMKTLSMISPMSWGLEGFWDILLRQGGVRDVLFEAGVLAALGAALLCLSICLLNRNR